MRVAIEFNWTPLGFVVLGPTGGLDFPPVPAVPGLYRFRFNFGDFVRRYIGETVNLRRRFSHYRNPGPTQMTNIRLNALLKEQLAAGATVALDLLARDCALLVENRPVAANLADKAVRRLLEHAAIVSDGGAEIESLNR